MGGYFSSVDLEMGVHVRLREVSAYGRRKMQSFSRKIAVCCPHMGGVRLQEVSVSGGSTAFYYPKLYAI